MTRVKICGITTAHDAALAVELGASAIGLVFWPESPRAVTPDRARDIVAALPPFVAAVGVFVNQTAEAGRLGEALRLSALQLHGDERIEDYRALRLPVIKAVGVSDDAAADAASALPDEVTPLLDAHDPVRRGGTGRTIDWRIAAAIARRRPVILSGGLHAGNAAAAVAAVRPYAIDVSSGVESTPGRKDAEKLRALFAALHP